MRELSVTASTTIVVDAGGNFVSGTPIVVTIPIPDTTWTIVSDGPVTFSQAGPGTLPTLPVGIDDKLTAVSGSIVVKPKLANLRFVLDCQPGSTVPPYTSLTPAAAAPFATLEAAAPVPAAVAPPPPPPPPPPAADVAASGLLLLRVAGDARRRARRAPGDPDRLPAGAQRLPRARLGAHADQGPQRHAPAVRRGDAPDRLQRPRRRACAPSARRSRAPGFT